MVGSTVRKTQRGGVFVCVCVCVCGYTCMLEAVTTTAWCKVNTRLRSNILCVPVMAAAVLMNHLVGEGWWGNWLVACV